MSDETTAAPAATEEAPTTEATPATHDFTPVATLTKDEVEVLDNARDEDESNDRTLRVALNHHSEVKNTLTKVITSWWEAMGKHHGFDPKEENFVLVRGADEGQPTVVARAADVEHLRATPSQD